MSLFVNRNIPFMTQDAVGMNRVCRAIAARRRAEANILPAPTDLPVPAPAPVPRLGQTAKWVGVIILVIHLVMWAVAWGLNIN